MPRLGAHTFIWAAEWTPQTAATIMQQAAAANLDLVEIPLLRPDEIDIETTRALSEQYAIAVTCSLGLPEQASLPQHPRQAEAFLKSALEVAHRLGSNCLTGVTYTTIGKLSGAAPSEQEYEILAKSLKPVAQHAATLGLELGLEPCNRYETHLLNTGRQCVELIERIGEDNVFVHFDTYHMNIEEKGFARAIVDAGRYCRYIHLSESDRGIPGSGTVDWDSIFQGLAEIGFDGDMVLESFMVIHPDIARALAVWRPVAPSSRAIVEQGFAFLRERANQAGLL
jgi:D-psicose/D-tagatose/L-ribulose 3-epimerase